MAEFTRPVLRYLNNLFGFVGGRIGLDRFDLVQPIQPVLDVSRIAQRASSVTLEDGLWIHTHTLTHAGAGVRRSAVDVYDAIRSELDYPTDQLDAWILDVWGLVNTPANLSIASAALLLPSTFPGSGGLLPVALLRFWSATVSVSSSAGTGDYNAMVSTAPNAVAQDQIRFPVRVPRGGRHSVRSESTGALQTTIHYLCWVGPRGSTPPGVV